MMRVNMGPTCFVPIPGPCWSYLTLWCNLIISKMQKQAYLMISLGIKGKTIITTLNRIVIPMWHVMWSLTSSLDLFWGFQDIHTSKCTVAWYWFDERGVRWLTGVTVVSFTIFLIFSFRWIHTMTVYRSWKLFFLEVWYDIVTW